MEEEAEVLLKVHRLNGNNRGQSKHGDNQFPIGTKPTCWYCNIYGHRQEDSRKCICENAPFKGLNESTYWSKQKQFPVGEGEEHQESQEAVGEM